MTKKLLITTAFVLSALTLPASAVDPSMQMTGTAFSEACTRAHESWISFCNGYIQAAVDNARQGDGVCISNGATRTDIVTVVEKAVTSSNQLRAMNAFEAVRLALQQSYPCS